MTVPICLQWLSMINDVANTVAPIRFFDPALQAIGEKVIEGSRLSLEEGAVLYETRDVHGVCRLADLVRRRMHGRVAYYNVNRHINYSNICALSCSFCAFHRKKDQDGAYEMSVEQVTQEAIKAEKAGATELHIVGGLHPWLDFRTTPRCSLRFAKRHPRSI